MPPITRYSVSFDKNWPPPGQSIRSNTEMCFDPANRASFPYRHASAKTYANNPNVHDVKVWGQLLIEKGAHGARDRFSGIEVPICPAYWERAELDLTTFLLFQNRKPDHMDYERAKAGTTTTQQTQAIGSQNSYIPIYGQLRTSRRQILKLWPLRHAGSPLDANRDQ